MPQAVTVRSDRYTIPTVTLKIATQKGSGRVEKYSNAMRLMRRLDEIGTRKLRVLSMSEEGQPTPALQVDALNHYLRTGSGLRYFRRTHFRWQDAIAWSQLRDLVGISR